MRGCSAACRSGEGADADGRTPNEPQPASAIPVLTAIRTGQRRDLCATALHRPEDTRLTSNLGRRVLGRRRRCLEPAQR